MINLKKEIIFQESIMESEVRWFLVQWSEGPVNDHQAEIWCKQLNTAALCYHLIKKDFHFFKLLIEKGSWGFQSLDCESELDFQTLGGGKLGELVPLSSFDSLLPPAAKLVGDKWFAWIIMLIICPFIILAFWITPLMKLDLKWQNYSIFP